MIFSFPAMLAGLLTALAVLTVRDRFADPDMWWHLKTGQVIWTTHSIPTTDIFSYTTGHHAYVPHEWLSQCLIYAGYRFGGNSGLMLWLCVLTSVLLVAGYGLCWLYSQNAKVAFVGALTIWLFATIGLAVRPQMIGYLLLIVELLLIQLGKTRNPRWFWGLPPLFALWVNCHGSFFVGLVTAGAILLCSFFNFEQGLVASQRWEPHIRRTFEWALVLAIAALFINPVGLKQVLYPIDTMLHQPVGLSASSEWQPLQFGDGRSLAFLAVTVGILLLAVLRYRSLYCQELFLLAMGAQLAASHRRMLFVFGILTAPTLTRLLSDTWETYHPDQDKPLPNAIFIAASALVVFLAFPGRQTLASQIEHQSPVKAVMFLAAHQVSGNMLNEYVYGGYLIWAAPEHPVFVDGRADVFEQTGVLSDYGSWATLQSNPTDLLYKYKIDFCLLSRESPMARVMSLLNWKTIYSDEYSIILVRDKGPMSF
ncbi:MAG: hypothetical protein JSS95_02510 [Acidobacteria bacterium]|nr:hypothetical protein [Acidobacteriota bacterium]